MFDGKLTLELDYPITEEQLDAILDIDMEHTVSVTFHTKHGKEVEFEKRKKGEWLLVKGSDGKDYHKCSECLHMQDITGVKNYCAVCGADMKGEYDDRH